MKTNELYKRVTERIVAELENGVLPWTKPWNAENTLTLPLRHNGQPYSGVNVLILWDSALEHGFQHAIWMTYKQAQQLGGHVHKGQHGTPIVYASTYIKTERTDEGEDVERSIRFLKSYTVFNVAQIDDLPAQYYATGKTPGFEPIEATETFVRNTRAEVRHGGNRAYYAPKADYIGMPVPESLDCRENYYSTLAHELTHWTGYKDRLDRNFSDSTRFGDDGYAREELVAELGAAFLCARLGLSHEPRADHASYIASWLKVLKADSRAIFNAAAHAQRATDYLASLQLEKEAAAADLAA